MSPAEIKTWVEIVQGAITILAIVATGIWTFYVFVLGRSYAPNIKISFRVRQVTKIRGLPIVSTEILIKNIGRIKTERKMCYLFVSPVNTDNHFDIIPFIRIDDPFVSTNPLAKTYELLAFSEAIYLEPSEEVSDSIVFAAPQEAPFQMTVLFSDGKMVWTATSVFGADMLPGEKIQ